MADLDAGNDGSLVEAGDAINRMLTGDPAREAVPEPNQAAPTERKRGADGKFLPSKPVPMTPADGSPDPDDALGEPDRPLADAEEPPPPEEPKEDEEPEAEDEPEAEEPPPVQKVRVKVDGIEQEVPIDEVVKGYSRTADYTRKTQALAEERRKFEAEELAPVREERKLYAERLDLLNDALRDLLPEKEPDWNTLRNALTPEQFQQAYAEYKVQSDRAARIRGERERVMQIEAEDAERRLARTLRDEHDKLKTAIPDFADEVKGRQLKEDLVAYAKSLSFTDDDLANVTDHRVLVLLNKARLHDEALLRKPKVEAKIDRVLDTVKPSTNAKPKPKLSELERQKTQLKKTGRVEDAAALLNSLGIR